MNKKQSSKRHVVELVALLALFASLAAATAAGVTIEPLMLGFMAIVYVAINIGYSAKRRAITIGSVSHHLATAALGVFLLLSL